MTLQQNDSQSLLMASLQIRPSSGCSGVHEDTQHICSLCTYLLNPLLAKPPVNWTCVPILFHKPFVRLLEMAAVEEATRGRQGAGMDRTEDKVSHALLLVTSQHRVLTLIPCTRLAAGVPQTRKHIPPTLDLPTTSITLLVNVSQP